MKQIRRHLTYANVMSSIAVFLMLGGATAFAATKIGANEIKANSIKTGKIVKEAVTAGKLKNGAVTESKIADGAVTNKKLADNAVTTTKIAANAVETSKINKASVTNEKLADNAVTGAKVQDGSLSGADINQGSLTAVKAANVYGVTFAETGSGSPKLLRASDPGIKSGGCFLVCSVEFPRDVSECSYTASSTFTSGGSGAPAMAETFPGGSANTVLVTMWDDEGNLTAHDFAMTVVCPTTS